MRVALVAPLVSPIAQPYVGGAQALLADLAVGLAQRGHQVTLFARVGSLLPGVHIEPIVVPTEVRPADFSQSFQARPADPAFFAQANLFLELFLQLQRRQAEFDLVHVHAFDWPAFACSPLIHSLPVLHTLHLPALSPEINAALRALHAQGHPLTLVTVSQACAHSYAEYTPIDHVIYNGLDLDAIPFSPRLTADAPLLFAGRIAPEKGVEDAIEIATRAGQRLLLAGGIYDQRYYEERIQPRIAAAGERAIYLGQMKREALWELMSESLGLLFPIAWEEPFGLTAVEAMATGTPVIAYRRGAAPEIILHGETGFLVAPGDVTAAAALVADLANISRARCHAHVKASFSLAQMLDAYEGLYAGVCYRSQPKFLPRSV